jgi:hypothetical protein
MRIKLATPALFLASVLASIELGGSLYEGLVVFPAWSSSPPASLALIQEPDGLDLVAFWIPVHLVLTIAMIAALVLNWRVPQRRMLILAGLGVYILMRAWTFLYFVPEITQFMSVPPEGQFSPELAARVSLWGTLGWIRRALIAVVSVVLLLALTSPASEGQLGASQERRQDHESMTIG